MPIGDELLGVDNGILPLQCEGKFCVRFLTLVSFNSATFVDPHWKIACILLIAGLRSTMTLIFHCDLAMIIRLNNNKRYDCCRE